MRRHRWVIGMLVAVAVALPTGIARADGDPASDILLGSPVFYPYQPAVSAPLQRSLTAAASAATRGGFPLKIALIDSAVDLGAVPELFGAPQKYAEFLDQEITFIYKGPLLVVMPTGYGIARVTPAVSGIVAALAKPAGRQSDDLARAALTAVPKLAAAAGHALARSAGTRSGVAAGTGGSSALIAVVLAAVACAAAVIAVRWRGRSRRR
jgi:hypothetical protein